MKLHCGDSLSSEDLSEQAWLFTASYSASQKNWREAVLVVRWWYSGGTQVLSRTLTFLSLFTYACCLHFSMAPEVLDIRLDRLEPY